MISPQRVAIVSQPEATVKTANGKYVFKRDGIFSGLEEEAIWEILKNSNIIRPKKGEFVFMQGDEANNFYMVMEGTVCIYMESENGQEVLINIPGPNDVFGKSALLDNAFYAANAQVLQDAAIMAISRNSIKQLMAAYPKFAQNLLSIVTLAGYQMTAQIGRIFTLSAPQRLGCFLLKMMEPKSGQKDAFIEFPFEKRIIASYLQMTPETFSRSISQLKDHGVSFEKNGIKVSDFDELKDFTCTNCTKVSMPFEKECKYAE